MRHLLCKTGPARRVLAACPCRRRHLPRRRPFCPLTLVARFSCRESLKTLGFSCRYDDKTWELPPRRYSADKEAQLRVLLESGELPSEAPPPPAALAPQAAGAQPAAAGPAAANAAATAQGTPIQRRELKRRREDDAEGGAGAGVQSGGPA